MVLKTIPPFLLMESMRELEMGLTILMLALFYSISLASAILTGVKWQAHI